jgi:hypothetical protein
MTHAATTAGPETTRPGRREGRALAAASFGLDVRLAVGSGMLTRHTGEYVRGNLFLKTTQ